MPDLTTTNLITPFVEGQQVTPSDLTGIVGNIDNAVGKLIDALGGPNFQFATGQLTVAPGTGMQVIVGGTGQRVIAQGRLLDVCPATPLTIAAAGGADRVDLIAIQATRVNSATAITRNVRADGTLFPLQVYTVTLTAGSTSFSIPASITSPVAVASAVGAGTGEISTQISGTTVSVLSSNSSDTRAVNVFVSGTITGGSGVSTNITQLEDTPAYVVVTGTSTSTPATPAGYDAFATVYVHASETSISSADITILFPQFPVLSAITHTISGAINLPGNITFAWGSVTSVPSDDTSDYPVSFTPAFTTAGIQFTASIDTGASDSGTQLSLRTFNFSRTGFSVHVSGGAPSSTVTIRYFAIGF